jgi:flagellar hook-basal body complex protein FliE
MSISQIRLGGVTDPRQAYTPPKATESGSSSFMDHLKNAVEKVDETQVRRDDAVESMVTGEVGEVHDVMIAAEEAKLSFELMLEVRNKLLDSYQQIMQMQV